MLINLPVLRGKAHRFYLIQPPTLGMQIVTPPVIHFSVDYNARIKRIDEVFTQSHVLDKV